MRPALKWRIAATIVSVIPIGFFLMFAVGEGAGGASHYLQVAPLVALIALGWYRGAIAGYILLALAFLFAILYAVTANGIPLLSIALVEGIVFVPTAAAGYCFLRSS